MGSHTRTEENRGEIVPDHKIEDFVSIKAKEKKQSIAMFECYILQQVKEIIRKH